nr:aminotransferase class V-fold PLP-dependent enzyme [Clostridium rectalis]
MPVKIACGNYVIYTNFDNAATTPPFVTVAEDVMEFLPYYSSIHRGMGYKSQFSTKVYEEGRKAVADFIGVDREKNTIIFVKNTTEAINKLSNMLYEKYDDSIILSTEMEHHSNDLPWRKFDIDYIKVDDNGVLLLSDLENKLKKYEGKVKLVAVTGASNVTGYKNNIYEIAKLTHYYGAQIFVDGAQLVPHSKVIMKGHKENDHIDYLAFSAHKMYAPFGIGVLIAPKDEFDDIEPDYKGGGTVDVVTHNSIKWNNTPEKDEAGSPNVVGVLALQSSINTLRTLRMDNIRLYEEQIFRYAFSRLRRISEITIYTGYHKSSVAIIPFNIKGIYHETLAKILSYEFGIAVRSGCFCAQPYIQKLLNISEEETKMIVENGGKRPGMVRLSFSLYNTFEEIDYLIYALETIISNKGWYLNIYNR